MKKGDVVNILDSSYSCTLTKDGFVHEFARNMNNEKYVVLEMGLELPAIIHATDQTTLKNDTILIGVDSRKYVFIKSGYCGLDETTKTEQFDCKKCEAKQICTKAVCFDSDVCKKLRVVIN